MKLNKQQEQALINLGLQQLLNGLIQPKVKKHPRAGKKPWNKGRKWSASQRAKFQRTMKKVWAEKNKNENKP